MAIYTRNSSHTPLPTFREDERDRVVPHSAYDSKDHTNIILSKLKTPSEKTVYAYLASLRGGVHSVTICRVCSLDARAVTFAWHRSCVRDLFFTWGMDFTNVVDYLQHVRRGKSYLSDPPPTTKSSIKPSGNAKEFLVDVT